MKTVCESPASVALEIHGIQERRLNKSSFLESSMQLCIDQICRGKPEDDGHALKFTV